MKRNEFDFIALIRTLNIKTISYQCDNEITFSA